MEKKRAMNILNSRSMIKLGSTKNVPVTNVSFEKPDGSQFVWESGDSEGEPYAIANFNMINKDGYKKAQKLFDLERYQDACNTNLSARVTLEQGRALQESMFATVIGRKTLLQPTDIDGNHLTDDDGNLLDKQEGIVVGKCVPNQAPDASETKASFEFGEEEDTEGAPTADRREATTA